MPSMMTTCAAHQVRPEAHAVVFAFVRGTHWFLAAFGSVLKKYSSIVCFCPDFAFLKYRLSLMFLEYVDVHEEES